MEIPGGQHPHLTGYSPDGTWHLGEKQILRVRRLCEVPLPLYSGERGLVGHTLAQFAVVCSEPPG
jgi:hypothetical protein